MTRCTQSRPGCNSHAPCDCASRATHVTAIPGGPAFAMPPIWIPAHSYVCLMLFLAAETQRTYRWAEAALMAARTVCCM